VTDLPAGTAKLIQYLNEAYGTERRLEVALQAHLGLASRTTYKKRLRDHLAETKRHGREVSRRIKQLGGSAETIDLPGPDAIGGVAQRAVAGAQRAVAMAQGPMHALRGTGDEEKQLKNAKTEYASEAEEIATYQAIIAVAQSVGDRDTVKLARSILRDEERMLGFLEKEIPRMAGAVVVAEVPRSQRATKAKGRRRSASAKRSSSRTSAARSGKTASKRSASRAGASKRSTARRSSAKRSAAGASKRAGARATASKRSSARAGTSRRAGAGTSTKRRGSSSARRSSAGGTLQPTAPPPPASPPPLVFAR
jgi:ferritin-like metal-binding protein YciE